VEAPPPSAAPAASVGAASRVAVRLATPGDIPAIEAIDRALGMASEKRPIVERAITEGRVVVADDGGTVAGYVRWSWFWEKVPFSTLARIHPDYQHHGHGRALYAAIEAHLRPRGHRFWLSSTEEDNTRSRAFHAALGFREIGALSELDQDVREVFLRKDL